MESSSDKQWARKYLIDPLNAPGPSEESGPGTSFRRDPSVTKGIASAVAREKNQKSPSVTTSSKGVRTPSSSGYPTPPASASPTRSSFHPSNPYSSISSSHRQSAFSDYAKAGPSPLNPNEPVTQKHRRRGSSLGERFPGDMSHRPLDQIKRDNKLANRSPHLRKKHLPGADTIDVLDQSLFGAAYHHEGPYDATLLARNTNYKSSPVAAVEDSNNEALKATAREHIQDSLLKKIPLQGVAVIPPGMSGLDGKVMNYEEGADLMREADAPGGAYKRWDHVKYHPEDLKGKGEPSYSIEKALKDHKHSHRRNVSEGQSIEMQPQRLRPSITHQRSVSGNNVHEYATVNNTNLKPMQTGSDVHRSASTGKRVGEGLKRRLGSLRIGKKTTDI